MLVCFFILSQAQSSQSKCTSAPKKNEALDPHRLSEVRETKDDYVFLYFIFQYFCEVCCILTCFLGGWVFWCADREGVSVLRYVLGLH